MQCKICNEKIILVPSLAERVRKYNQDANYYKSIFTKHDACQIKANAESASRLMAKANKEYNLRYLEQRKQTYPINLIS